MVVVVGRKRRNDGEEGRTTTLKLSLKGCDAVEEEDSIDERGCCCWRSRLEVDAREEKKEPSRRKEKTNLTGRREDEEEEEARKRRRRMERRFLLELEEKDSRGGWKEKPNFRDPRVVDFSREVKKGVLLQGEEQRPKGSG